MCIDESKKSVFLCSCSVNTIIVHYTHIRTHCVFLSLYFIHFILFLPFLDGGGVGVRDGGDDGVEPKDTNDRGSVLVDGNCGSVG